jgi:hypothetical protein
MARRTNFFQVLINPPIQSLYLTDSVRPSRSESTDNLITNLSRDALISLYPLDGSKRIAARIEYVEWLLKKLLFRTFDNSRYFFDVNYWESEVSIVDEPFIRRDEYSLLRRISIRVFYANDRFLIAFDPRTKLYSRLSLANLLARHRFEATHFIERNDCIVFVEKNGLRRWVRGRIRDFAANDRVKVEVASLFKGTLEIASTRVIPYLNRADLTSVVKLAHPNLDLDSEIKTYSEFSQTEKEAAIRKFLSRYLKPIFPIHVGHTEVQISETQLDAELFASFEVKDDESQYFVARPKHRLVQDRRRLPALSKVQISAPAVEHAVVLFGSKFGVSKLRNIISELNDGITQGNFRFSLPAKFGIKLKVADEFTNDKFGRFDLETDQFLLSNEEKHRNALALVYLPPHSDLYYPIKAKLAHYGRVSQVISQQHFDIYAAWNLATNIYAKLGHIPWSIGESVTFPNADIVLGFAYSSLKHEGRVKRNIGYVNVFDKNGVWRFMQSSSTLLDFEKRLWQIPQLIRNAIIAFHAGGTSPRIIDIHYSKRFSAVERKRTADIIREAVPDIQQINFVSIDRSHPLRIFDSNTRSLNLLRGGIIQLNSNEFLLSTAADDNPDSPAGRLLKLRVWSESFREPFEILPIAYRVLAMTKLNWRSAVRETSEPVTLKYAQEIANLTNHFGLTEWTTVNNQLSNVPWFI